MQQHKTKIIPFTGEFYPSSEASPQTNRDISPLITAIVLAMVSGIAVGAIVSHQSAGYQRLEEYKANSNKLKQVQKTLCGI